MLSRSDRLRTREVADVLVRGRALPAGKYLSAKIFYPPGAIDDTMRCAVVVSKKIARNSVTRNRVRRAVYDSIRGFREKCFNGRAAHVVFFVRSLPTDVRSASGAFANDMERIVGSASFNK